MPREKAGYRDALEHANTHGEVRTLLGSKVMELDNIKDPRKLKRLYGITPTGTILESEYIRLKCI